MKRTATLAIAAAMAAATPAFAVDTIDFETNDSGGATTPGSVIGLTDYDALGVTFIGAFYQRCGGGCPSPSDGIFVSSSDFRAPLAIIFSDVTNGFTFSNVSNSAGTAIARDAGDNILATITFSGFPSSFSFLQNGIKSVTFFSNSQFGVDDLMFGNVAGGVPEPATWAMMILGFGVIGGALRSRRRGTVRVAYS